MAKIGKNGLQAKNQLIDFIGLSKTHFGRKQLQIQIGEGIDPGDVVLVPFPYRDRLAERARPAVVVSAATYNQYGDVVIAAITSHTPRVAMDVAMVDWAAAGLRLPSTVRMLFATVARARILLHIGHLTERDWLQVQERLRMVFTWL